MTLIQTDPTMPDWRWLMHCDCGTVLVLDARAEEEAKREAAARHMCRGRKEVGRAQATD